MKFLKNLYAIVVIIVLLPYMLFLSLYKPSLKKFMGKKGLHYPPEKLSYTDLKMLCNKGYKDALVAFLVRNTPYKLKEAKKKVEDFLVYEEGGYLSFTKSIFDESIAPDENLQALVDEENASAAIEYLRVTHNISLTQAKAYLNRHAPKLLNHNPIFTQI